jgi:hypothetical protein
MMLPLFTPEGVLPPDDYLMTIADLKASFLVTGDGVTSKNWDTDWRFMLVENLHILVSELWQVGIDKIFIDGSFVEEKDHPNDIDGYFECDPMDVYTKKLNDKLNSINPHKIWTWDAGSRRYDSDTRKRQLPMWHQYLVELYPFIPGLPSGIPDEFGNPQEFPAAFRKTRLRQTPDGVRMFPKGIIQIIK